MKMPTYKQDFYMYIICYSGIIILTIPLILDILFDKRYSTCCKLDNITSRNNNSKDVICGNCNCRRTEIFKTESDIGKEDERT